MMMMIPPLYHFQLRIYKTSVNKQCVVLDCGNGEGTLRQPNTAVSQCPNNCSQPSNCGHGCNFHLHHGRCRRGQINLPDGKKVQSTHVCDINIPGLPTILTGHIVPSLTITSLIGIRPLCKAQGYI